MLQKVVRRSQRILSDWSLGSISREVKRRNLTYLSGVKLRAIEQELQRINRERVPGALLEFGVALGGSGILIAKLGRDGPIRRPFHGFDVFGMIPPPTSDKDDTKSRERYEVIRSGASTGLGQDGYYGYRSDLFGDVKKAFAAMGESIDMETTALHKGLFEETWPLVAGSIDTVAFAHLDCDWYDPVRYCLNAVRDKMAVGGAIVLDDYNDYAGCRTATDEFLGENRDYRIARTSGNLVLHRLG